MAGFAELTIDQGANFSTAVTVKDANGSGLNLSGYTVASQMRKSYYSTSSNTFTSTITDSGNGEITIAMTGANTSNLTPGRYVYDLLITSGPGIKTRVVEGIITVLPSVTR